MALDVIGAGFGRTGTLSLKVALERLGFALCYHMLELRDHPQHVDHWLRAARGEDVDWEGLFSGYRAAYAMATGPALAAPNRQNLSNPKKSTTASRSSNCAFRVWSPTSRPENPVPRTSYLISILFSDSS